MSSEVMAALVLGGIGLLTVVFFVFALRRARARRMAELEEPAALREREEEPPPEPTAAPVAAPAPEPGSTASTEPVLDEATPMAPDEAVDAVESAPKPQAEEAAAPAAQEAVAASLDAAPVEDDRENREAMARGLSKTRESFLGKLNSLFGGGKKVDGAVLDDLEEVLLTADVGVALTMELIDELRGELAKGKLDSAEAVRASLRAKMARVVAGQARAQADDPLAVAGKAPRVILFVGVNGVGKTTTIGKIASQLAASGHSVVMAAGDTFRAAAAEQLSIWAERSGARLIRGAEGADPASVIFNAVQHAQETGADFVLADTAGRLHTKAELMDEIKKVKRAASKAREGAPDETWLVIDATTGQNGLQQANEFNRALELSGVVLTKLDGTAKGGVVVAIASALGIPVRFVGVGEKATDLRPFNAEQFIDALFDAA